MDLKLRIVSLSKTKNKEPRTVPLSKRATELFRKALDHPRRPPETDLIFFGEPGRDGKRRPYQFLSIWRKIKIAAGVPDVWFHDLRHEAISRLVENRFSDLEVASISGHRSMQMVKRYTHLRNEHLVKLLDSQKRQLGSAELFEAGKPLRFLLLLHTAATVKNRAHSQGREVEPPA